MSEHLITGVVTDAAGLPAAGAVVTLTPSYQPRGVPEHRSLGLTQDEAGAWRWVLDLVANRRCEARMTTDENGRFSLPVEGRLAEVAARNRLAVWAEKGPLVALRTLFRVEPSLRPQQLTLRESLLPVVHLVDPDGSPIAGAEAELSLSVANEFGDTIPEWHYWLGGRSDETGRIAFPRVPANPAWTAWLVVNAPGRARVRESDLDAGDYFGQTARVVIPRGIEVRGRVQRATSDSSGPILVWSFRRDEDPQPNDGHQLFAAADGTFVLNDVPRIDAAVVIEELPEPCPPDEARERRRELPRKVIDLGGRLDAPVDLGIVPLSPPLSISGRVQLPDGRAPASGWVSTEPPAQASYPIEKDGTFRVTGLEPGTHRLTFWVVEDESAEGEPVRDTFEAEEEFETGATDVLVRIHGGGNVIVRFHPKGRPSEPLEVWSPSLAWGHCGGGTYGKASEIRMSFEPGLRSDLRIEAEGFKTLMLGAVDILGDRPTVVDVELEPEDPPVA